jgi:hypothetical protein
MRGLKEGDIFEVATDGTKQFIQYLATDSSCLNGHVVRAFDYEVGKGDAYSLDEVVKKPIKFYTHTIIQAGVKLNVWKKVGNVPLGKDFKLPKFRQSEDYGNPEIKKSYKWYFWEVSGPTVDIGELTDDYSRLSVGGLKHSLAILEWLKTGKDIFKYPS